MELTELCDKLIYGKECNHGHANSNGNCIRYARGGGCVRCTLPSKENHSDWRINEYYKNKKTHAVKELTEEQKKKRSEASMRWTNKNKDKHAGYQAKYQNKPEIKEKRKIATLERYHLLSPEEKRELNQKRYQATKADDYVPRSNRTPEEQKAFILMKKEERKASARARYALMTKEEKQELMLKKKAYVENKRAREQQDD